jgi:hypothetical protein
MFISLITRYIKNRLHKKQFFVSYNWESFSKVNCAFSALLHSALGYTSYRYHKRFHDQHARSDEKRGHGILKSFSIRFQHNPTNTWGQPFVFLVHHGLVGNYTKVEYSVLQVMRESLSSASKSEGGFGMTR